MEATSVLAFVSSNGILFSLLSLTFQGFGLLREVIQHSATETQKKFNRTYSPLHALALWIFLTPAVEQLERMEDQILHQSDEDILAFKTSYSFDCSMIAVAGAIIAQIAVTAFSLPSLSKTHWIARAFFLISLLSGCLSVVYACVIQRILARFRKPTDIREWMRRPPTSPIIREYTSLTTLEFEILEILWRRISRKISPAESREQISDSYRCCFLGNPILRPNAIPPEEQLSASIPAAALLAAPSVMLTMSVSFLLTGLTVYLATWARNLDSDAGVNDSRNVFIFFIIGLILCCLFYALPTLYKYLESLKLERLQLEGDRDLAEAEKNTVESAKRADALLDRLKKKGIPKSLVKWLLPFLYSDLETGLNWKLQNDTAQLPTSAQMPSIAVLPNDGGVTSALTQTNLPVVGPSFDNTAPSQPVGSLPEMSPNQVGSTDANLAPIIQALRAAALAQERCAEANRKLAIEYAMLDAGNPFPTGS